MEIQVAGRVMADMFDDESHIEKRVEVAWRSKLRMLSNDSNRQNVVFGRKRTSGVSGMVVTYQLCKYSEQLRELSALNLLPTNDQDP